MNNLLEFKIERKGGSRMSHLIKNLKISFIALILCFNLLAIVGIATSQKAHAAAEGNIDSTYGLSNSTSENALTGMSGEVKKWITLIRLIGGGVVVIFIIIAGIMLGGSLGNSQKRGAATAALLGSGLGIYVIAKAGTIAHYFINAG
jgi:hypothetical protein